MCERPHKVLVPRCPSALGRGQWRRTLFTLLLSSSPHAASVVTTCGISRLVPLRHSFCVCALEVGEKNRSSDVS